MDMLLGLAFLLLLYVLNIDNLYLTMDINVLMFSICIGTVAYLLLRHDPMVLCHVSGVICATYALMINYYKQK